MSNVVTVGVATALPRVAARFNDPKIVLKALKDKGEMLSWQLESALAQAVGRMLVLIPHDPMSITLSVRHEPAEFYAEEKTLIGVRYPAGILRNCDTLSDTSIRWNQTCLQHTPGLHLSFAVRQSLHFS